MNLKSLDLSKKEYTLPSSDLEGWKSITDVGLDNVGNRADSNMDVIDGKILPGSITENLLKLRPKYVYDDSGTIIGTVNFKLSN